MMCSKVSKLSEWKDNLHCRVSSQAGLKGWEAARIHHYRCSTCGRRYRHQLVVLWETGERRVGAISVWHHGNIIIKIQYRVLSMAPCNKMPIIMFLTDLWEKQTHREEYKMKLTTACLRAALILAQWQLFKVVVEGTRHLGTLSSAGCSVPLTTPTAIQVPFFTWSKVQQKGSGRRDMVTLQFYNTYM